MEQDQERLERDRIRFMSYVTKSEDGCWLWKGGLDIKGYSVFFYRGKAVFGHRASLLLHNKVKDFIPGLQIRHSCRNKNCVNPNHLSEGTRKQKAEDKRRDGTNLSGTKCHFAKLNWDLVAEIRKLAEAGEMSRKEIATKYGVSSYAISSIISSKTWIPPL